MHLSDRGKEAAVRSLEGPPTLPFTCVTSACQCHQGASIFHLGISLPVAARCTSLASMPLPAPIPPTSCSLRHLSLNCHFFHQLLASSYFSCTSLSGGGERTIGAKMVTILSQFQGLAAMRDDTQVRCQLKAASH